MKKKYGLGLTYTDKFFNSLKFIHSEEMEGCLDRIFTMKWRKLLQVMIILAIMSMGYAVEISCEDDSDCPAHQFCYGTSKFCVNYTDCTRFNRSGGSTSAQTPQQCGECFEGYEAEPLATGEVEIVCKKQTVDIEMPIIKGVNTLWIYLGMIIGITILIFVLLMIYCRKRFTAGDEKWFRAMGAWKFTPSAPPQEHGSYHLQQSFYADEEPPIYSSVISNDLTDAHNNNNNVKDRLVNAVPFNPPSWVNTDNNYDEEDGAGNTSASTAISTTLEIEDEETTPSSWTPENVTVQVPARAFHQFASEQRDNVVNAVLVRGACSSNTPPAEDANSGPTPESRDSGRNNGNNYRGTSVQINQMITLNMVKEQ